MYLELYRVGAVLDGKLRLERLIAAGGGGAVFEASHVGLATRVAVKVLRPGPEGVGERRLQRFLREARIAAKLKSAHAVRILDIATPPQGTPYLVMEYLQGETLGEMLQRCGPLPIPDAVDYVLQAIEPLAEMHASGIVHRDVKPSNLFLARGPNGATSLKLLDFGVATPDPSSEAELELTMTNAEIGTPLYMSPEQFMSAKHVDARVDIWSLGVTLYQLIAGRTPFTAHTILSLRTRILEEQPESLEKVRPEVPRALAEVVMQCLAKEPTSRISDVATLARALEPFAGRQAASSVPRMLHAVSTEPMVMSTRPPVRDDEAETIDAGFEHLTPLPYMLPKALRVPRARLLRVAMIPTIACVLFLLIALIGRNGATGDVRHAASVRDEPQKGMALAAADERIELPPVIEERPREERVAEVVPVRTRSSVPARRPGSFGSSGRNGRSSASHPSSRPPARAGNSSQPPRTPASEPDPIDDRIE
jgi:hypothetical protein